MHESILDHLRVSFARERSAVCASAALCMQSACQNQTPLRLRTDGDPRRAQGAAHALGDPARAAPLPHGACRMVHHRRRHGVCVCGLLDILDYEVNEHESIQRI